MSNLVGGKLFVFLYHLLICFALLYYHW